MPISIHFSVLFCLDPANQENAKRFIGFCLHELYEIDLCIECYRNANERQGDWFTKVCNYPHILVWARCGDQFLPAKAMGFKQTFYMTGIFVRYFGSKRYGTINPNECYLLSTIHPRGIQFDQVEEHKAAKLVSCALD